MASLHLVRHGQASFLQADYDRLSPAGEAQARRLGEYWVAQGLRFEQVVSGPRVRQRRTAELVGDVYRRSGLPWPELAIVDELDEMQTQELVEQVLADLAGTSPTSSTIAHLAAQFRAAAALPDAARSFQRLYEEVVTRWARGEIEAPGVEPWQVFRARVRAALERLTTAGSDAGARGRRLAAFTSGGPIGAALQLALDTSDDKTLQLSWMVRNASITEFLFQPGRFTLSTFNAVPHLGEHELTYR